MTLYVVALPDPPAGTDFTFVVPGINVYDVVGITATLTTTTVFTGTMHDSSGNGNDGTYELFGSPSPLGPGLIPGANAATWGFNSSPADRYGELASGVDCGQPFSFDVWVAPDPASNEAVLFALNAADVLTTCDMIVAADGTIAFRWAGSGPLYTAATAAGTCPYDGSTHHVGIAYDGTHAKIYLDGVSVAVTETGPGGTAVDAFCVMDMGGGTPTGPTGTHSKFGQPAFYQSVLAAGAFAAHHSANGSLTAYAAAVLAGAPINFYELNDGGASTGRQPSLIVTNATTELEAIPTGFPAVSTPGPYDYAWQPGLNADSQSQDGTLTTVAIPRLILPGGYTVGVRTLDLTGTDQWSNVNLWWNSDVQDATKFRENYRYPPGVWLRYAKAGTTA